VSGTCWAPTPCRCNCCKAKKLVWTFHPCSDKNGTEIPINSKRLHISNVFALKAKRLYRLMACNLFLVRACSVLNFFL
jgi:hypothetical protein